MKVFISSTFEDLEEERRILGKALDRILVTEKISMEYFGSLPESPYEACMKRVESADLLIGIYAHRYGNTPEGFEKSITELEYQKAIALGIPVLVYIADPERPTLTDYIESDPQKKKKVIDFKNNLLKKHVVSFFSNPHQLAWMVVADIINWLESNRPQEPTQLKVPPIVGEVKAWLEAIGFDVTPQYKTISDLLVQKEDSDTFMLQFIKVRCKEGRATEYDVKVFCEELDKGLGWFISSEEPVKLATDFSVSQKRVKVFSLTELINKQIRLMEYADYLRHFYKESEIADYYVDLSCIKEESDKSTIVTRVYEIIDDYIDNWLNADYKNHISILGEFGTGKTWFCWHFALRQLERYAQNPMRERFPLLIPLRDYAKAVSVESLFSEFFFRKHHTGITNYDAFTQLNRMGKFLIIFDGFDEMQRKVDYQTVVDNFWSLSKVIVPNSKVILTCRTEHFRYEAEAKEIMEGRAKGSKKIELEPPKFEVIHLKELSETQILKMLSKRLGTERGKKIYDIILSKPNLSEMIKKPLMIELVLDTLPEIETIPQINVSDIYYYATMRKLDKDVSVKRTFTSINDKVYFMCELAWEMLCNGEFKISYKDVPARINDYFERLGKPVKKKEIDHWAFDLQNSTLLKRDNEGNYEFAHKSLVEYFVAYKLAYELGVLGEKYLEFIHGEESKTETRQKSAINLPYSNGRSMNTFGRQVFTEIPEVALFLDGLASNRNALWDALLWTKNKTMETCGYIGTNAALLLLRNDPCCFKEKDLSNTVLPYTSFDNCDLTEANLSGADLRHTRLTNVNLENANLSDADLRDVEFTTMSQIFSIDMSPNGKLLATGGADKYVRVFRLDTLEELMRFRGHQDWVNHVFWHPNGKEILSSSDDDTIRFWELDTGKEVYVEQLRKRSEKESRIGSTCLLSRLNLLVTIDKDANITLYDIETKKYVNSFKLAFPNDQRYGIYSSPSGNEIAIFHQGIASILDTSSWRTISKIDQVYGGWHSCFNDDSSLLATRSSSCALAIWSIKNGKIEKLFNKNLDHIEAFAFDSNWEKVVISSFGWDSQELKSKGDPICRVFNVVNGEEITTLRQGVPRIEDLRFTYDNKSLVCGLMNGAIELWNMDENSKEFGKQIGSSEIKQNNISHTLIANAKGLDVPFSKQVSSWPHVKYFTLKEHLLLHGAKDSL